jgi:hypothetical protein
MMCVKRTSPRIVQDAMTPGGRFPHQQMRRLEMEKKFAQAT